MPLINTINGINAVSGINIVGCYIKITKELDFVSRLMVKGKKFNMKTFLANLEVGYKNDELLVKIIGHI